MQALTLRASAKVNLTLFVGKSRPDGYHGISTIMQKISLFDMLTFEKAEATSCVTDLRYLPSDGRNLCVRAVENYGRLTGIDARLKIGVEKKIPVGSGLGGGSADAAATIRALETLYEPLDDQTRSTLALSLGADVPFCLKSCNTALCEGVGERITPIENRLDAELLLYKEGRKASTARVYAAFDALEAPSQDAPEKRIGRVIDALNRGDVDAFCQSAFNDLTGAISSLGLPVEEGLSRLCALGARGALMSGAGPTIYGVFTDPAALYKAQGALYAPDRFCARAHFLH